MNKLIREVLDPIVYDMQSEFYVLRYNLRLRFRDKSNKELKLIIKATRRVRYWNCGWITYVMATVIREIAQETIRLRKIEEIS